MEDPLTSDFRKRTGKPCGSSRKTSDPVRDSNWITADKKKYLTAQVGCAMMRMLWMKGRRVHARRQTETEHAAGLLWRASDTAPAGML